MVEFDNALVTIHQIRWDLPEEAPSAEVSGE